MYSNKFQRRWRNKNKQTTGGKVFVEVINLNMENGCFA